jgi:hypothetical protein
VCAVWVTHRARAPPQHLNAKSQKKKKKKKKRRRLGPASVTLESCSAKECNVRGMPCNYRPRVLAQHTTHKTQHTRAKGTFKLGCADINRKCCSVCGTHFAKRCDQQYNVNVSCCCLLLRFGSGITIIKSPHNTPEANTSRRRKKRKEEEEDDNDDAPLCQTRSATAPPRPDLQRQRCM